MNLALVPDFSFIDGAALVVALLATVLYILEASILFRKPEKFYEEWVITMTVTVFLLYESGNFLSLFARALVADAANVTYRIGWIIATTGFAFIPSFLLHSYGSCYYYFRVGTKRAAPRAKVPNGLLIGSHLLGFYFIFQFLKNVLSTSSLPWPVLTSNIDPLQFKLFSVWLAVASATAGVYSIRLVQNPYWERWRRYFPMNGIFLLLSSVIILLVLLQHPWTPTTAPLVRLLFLSIALFPGAFLAYFLVQYQFMNIFVRPTLIYAVLTGIIVLVYQLGIRNVSEYLAQFPAVNVRLVEIVLLLALIFLVHPVRTRLQARINAMFFQESKKFRDTIYSISRELKSSFDLDKIKQALSARLQEILRVKHLDILLLLKGEADRIPATVRLLNRTSESFLFSHVAPHVVAKEMIKENFELVLAVRDGTEILGIIGIGPKKFREEMSNDEIHLLKTIANQLAVSIRNAALVEEQLKIERLMIRQEKLSSLGQIAASITHEVKNPISSINTLVQVMQEELPTGGDLIDDLKTIEEEIARLNRVLSETLKYARPESMELSPVSVDEVLQDVLVLLQKEAEKCGVQVSLRAGTDAQVMASLDGLKQVFFNILFNAIQACDQGGGEVKVESRIANGRAVVTFEDTGPGIPEDRLRRVFDPFYTTRETGTGLGLAIAKQKMEEFRGSISAENLKSGGARFTVTLPVMKKVREVVVGKQKVDITTDMLN